MAKSVLWGHSDFFFNLFHCVFLLHCLCCFMEVGEQMHRPIDVCVRCERWSDVQNSAKYSYPLPWWELWSPTSIWLPIHITWQNISVSVRVGWVARHKPSALYTSELNLLRRVEEPFTSILLTRNTFYFILKCDSLKTGVFKTLVAMNFVPQILELLLADSWKSLHERQIGSPHNYPWNHNPVSYICLCVFELWKLLS